MKILVACEYSGRVRNAFARRGHTAVSCDLRATEAPHGWHIQGDVLEVIRSGWESWDMLIGHPYCTYNNLAGIRWMYHPDDTHLPAVERRRHPRYPGRMDDFMQGVAFFRALRDCGIPKIVLENSMPHGLAMEHLGRYDQIVQPWHFGSPFTKAAALWLKGLPKLVPTHQKSDYAPGEIHAACHLMPPGPARTVSASAAVPTLPLLRHSLRNGADRITIYPPKENQMDQSPHNNELMDGHVIRPEPIESYLPKELTEAILASDVTILLADSDAVDEKMAVRFVYALGLPEPERIASHAYAHAIRESHQDLLRAVRGEPTDAMRYQALREFAVLAATDPARFQAVNMMLQRFEETTMEGDAADQTGANHDSTADFLIHALLETAPLVVEQRAPSAH